MVNECYERKIFFQILVTTLEKIVVPTFLYNFYWFQSRKEKKHNTGDLKDLLLD